MFRSIARLGRFLIVRLAMLIAAVVFAVGGAWMVFGHGPLLSLPNGERGIYSMANELREQGVERLEQIKGIIQEEPQLTVRCVAFVVVVLPLYIIAMALHRIARRLSRLAQTQLNVSSPKR